MFQEVLIEAFHWISGSPIVFAPMTNGMLEFLVEYPKLKSIAIKDVYLIPRMDSYIDTLSKAKLLFTDCNNNYWQILVDDQDRKKNVFVPHQGLFRFTGMIWDSKASGLFQFPILTILSFLRCKFAIFYLEYNIGFLKTIEDHMHHWEPVTQC